MRPSSRAPLGAQRARVVRLLVVSLTSVVAADRAVAQATPDAVVAEACRRRLGGAEAIERAVATLEPVLPRRPWTRLTLATMPARVSSNVRASVLPAAAADPEGGPVLYWRPAIDGADVVHELTHALHASLHPTARDALLARVAAHDATVGFAVAVVDGAATSVVHGVALAMPAPRAERVTRTLRDALTGERASGPGALARLEAALARAIERRGMDDVRGLLARSGASGDDWRRALRAMILGEAHAYEAGARCRDGLASALWSPRPGQPRSAATVARVSGDGSASNSARSRRANSS